MALSPIRKGRDNIFWTYGGGVWSPDVDVVEDRLVQLLGQRFRKTHLGTIEAVVRSYSDSITCDPVSEFINFTNGLLDWRTGELKRTILIFPAPCNWVFLMTLRRNARPSISLSPRSFRLMLSRRFGS